MISSAGIRSVAAREKTTLPREIDSSAGSAQGGEGPSEEAQRNQQSDQPEAHGPQRMDHAARNIE